MTKAQWIGGICVGIVMIAGTATKSLKLPPYLPSQNQSGTRRNSLAHLICWCLVGVAAAHLQGGLLALIVVKVCWLLAPGLKTKIEGVLRLPIIEAMERHQVGLRDRDRLAILQLLDGARTQDSRRLDQHTVLPSSILQLALQALLLQGILVLWEALLLQVLWEALLLQVHLPLHLLGISSPVHLLVHGVLHHQGLGVDRLPIILARRHRVTGHHHLQERVERVERDLQFMMISAVMTSMGKAKAKEKAAGKERSRRRKGRETRSSATITKTRRSTIWPWMDLMAKVHQLTSLQTRSPH